jgi:hypothetical protein
MSHVPVELPECKFYLVGVQEVIWDNGGTEPAELYILLWIWKC